MKEIWKDIVGYENYYQISTVGNIVNFKNYTMRQCVDYGYKRINLSKDGKKIKQAVHRLVALAFIPNPLNKSQVNHINGIKTDNRVENLEWMTPSENIKHAYDNHLNCKKGERHNNSIFSNEDVLRIRNLYDNGMKIVDINKMFDCSYWAIKDICKRKRWKHL